MAGVSGYLKDNEDLEKEVRDGSCGNGCGRKS